MGRTVSLVGATDPPGEHPLIDEALFVGAFLARPHQAAILDEAGTILSVKAAWQEFARDNSGDPNGYVGSSYLAA